MNKVFVRVLNKINLLKYFNLKSSIFLNKKRFVIPVNGGIGFSNLFMSEPWMIQVLKIVLQIDSKRFVDVGVNIGQTLLKLRSVSEAIPYIGFEPNPICVNYTNTLVDINSLKNVALIPIGISNENKVGKLVFFSEGKSDSSASIIENFRPHQKIFKKEFIPLFNLKSIKSVIGDEPFSVLKIDVEGAELEVIQSFIEDIKSYAPIILIEILPAYSEKNTERINRQNEIQSILIDLNYSMFRVIKNNEALVSFEEIKKIEIHSDENACEYVMVPNSKKDHFISLYKSMLEYK